MATIYNSDLTKEITEGAKLQVSRDKVPNQIAEKVVPVMEVNPKLLRRVNFGSQNSANNVTSATIMTTAADKDFFITSVSLGMIKDATSTSTQSQLSCVINNVTTALLSIPSLTLTAQTAYMQQAYSVPIKVDRNSIITVSNTTNVANISTRGTVQGYYVENINS